MAEYPTAQPRQRNREVPFPEKDDLYRAGELEQLILADKWLESASLPDSITSVAIDNYATWLSQLTNYDPQHRERGSFLFLGAETGKWTLPTNPLVGTELSVANLTTKQPKKHYPVAGFHSHPDSTAPSGADITRMLGNEGWFFEGGNDSFIDIVGAQRFNYLLIRCSDSEFIDADRIEKMLTQYQGIVDNANMAMARFVVSLARDSGLPEEGVANILEKVALKEQEQFGANYSRYFATLNVVNAIAEQQKFGFYRSAQDGLFKKIIREDLTTIREKEGELVVNTISETVDSTIDT